MSTIPLGSRVGSMAALVLEVFEFTDANHWHWRLTDAGGGFLGGHAVSLDPGAFEYGGLKDLPGWLDYHASTDQRARDEQALLARFGGWLTAQVFGQLAPILAKYAPVTVRVALPPAAEALVGYPFEAAWINGRPLALAGITLVYTVAGDHPKPAAQALTGALRVLALFSLPPAASPLNLRRERQALRTLVHELNGDGQQATIDLKALQYGTSRQTLEDALQDGDGWDVVHFSGHGLRGAVVLEQADGSADLLRAEELADLLRPYRQRLKLVTISACHSGETSLAATLTALGLEPRATREVAPAAPPEGAAVALSGVARQLARELDCAVLAMRFAVEDAFAIALTEALYRQLWQKKAHLTTALARAIKQAQAGCGALSLATPALFGRAAAELMLVPPKAAGEIKPDPVLFTFPKEREHFVGRVGVLTRASTALTAESGRSGVLFHGMAGGGKSACAIELAHHLRPTGRFAGYVWFKAPDQGQDVSDAFSQLALAFETSFPHFPMLQVVGHQAELTRWLPHLRQFLADKAILIGLDNLESLLTPSGVWLDPQLGQVVAALLDHGGLSRTLLTSRILPADLPATLLVEPVLALTLDEAVLLMGEQRQLGALIHGDREAHTLALGVLRVVQGHPKLIELAEGQAADRTALAAQVAEAEQAWQRDGSSLSPFFTRGTSAADAHQFLAALKHWTDTITRHLPDPSRTLFQLLCALEEGDREDWVVEQVWPLVWQALGKEGEAPPLREGGAGWLEALREAARLAEGPPPQPSPANCGGGSFLAGGGGGGEESAAPISPPSPGADGGGSPRSGGVGVAPPAPPPAGPLPAPCLPPLVAAALVEARTEGKLTRLLLHPGVAEAGRASAPPALRQAVDQALAGFWEALFDHGMANQSSGGGPLIRRAGRAAAPYLMRRKQWDTAGRLLEQVVHHDQSLATNAAVLPLMHKTI